VACCKSILLGVTLIIIIFIFGNMQLYIYKKNASSCNWIFKTVYCRAVYIHNTGDRYGSNCTKQ